MGRINNRYKRDMKTAIEWLVNEINATDWWYLPESIKQDVIQQAKEMEKEQIEKAFEDGNINEWMGDNIKGEQYYNETFKSE